LFDLSTLEGLKLPQKRPKDRYRLYRWLSIALTYYRFFYVEGLNSQKALKRTEDVFKPRMSPSTIKSAVRYYNDATGLGFKRLSESPGYGIYRDFVVHGSVIDDYQIKRKPLPYWLLTYRDPQP
jgi:hypothetical protein